MRASTNTGSGPLPSEAEQLRSEHPAPVLLTEREAADLLRLSPRTLQRLRDAGGGPRFIRAGVRADAGKILYDQAALVKWLDSRTSQDTRDNVECGERPS